MKLTKIKKREADKNGVLFFYTEQNSHRFEKAAFRPWQTGTSETTDNMHYVKLHWSTLKIDL